MSTLVVPKTSSPIMPRLSVDTPPDEDRVTVQAEGALEGQAEKPKAEGESSPESTQ